MLHTKSIRKLKTGWLQEGQENSEKPILFFLHGFPDEPDTWKSQMKHFSDKGHIVAAPYLRGLKPSAPTPENSRYGLESVALDHLAILREIDPEEKHKVCLIGHDIGAIHAWHLARLLKGRLNSLVLINGPSLDQMSRRVTDAKQVVKSWYAFAFQSRIIGRLLLPSVLKSLNRKPSKSSITKIEPLLQHYREAMKGVPMSLLKEQEKIEAPVLVIWSKDDPYLQIPTHDELDKISSDHTIRVLEGSHWLHQEKAKKINSLIEEFF